MKRLIFFTFLFITSCIALAQTKPSYKDVELTSGGGTENLSLTETNSIIRIFSSGYITLTSNWTIQSSGTAKQGHQFDVIYDADVDLNGSSITLFGLNLDSVARRDTIDDKLYIKAYYDGSQWDVVVNASKTASENITSYNIVNKTIRTEDYSDNSVTLDVIEDIPQGSLIVGKSTGSDTLNAKNSGYILVGDGTDLNSVELKGDATIDGDGNITVIGVSTVLGDYVLLAGDTMTGWLRMKDDNGIILNTDSINDKDDIISNGDTLGQFAYWRPFLSKWDTVPRDLMIYNAVDTSFYIKEIDSDTIRVGIAESSDSAVIADDYLRFYRSGERQGTFSRTNMALSRSGEYSTEITGDQFLISNDTKAEVFISNNNNADNSHISLLRARGDFNTYTTVQSGDILGDIKYIGATTGGNGVFNTDVRPSVILRSTATENFSLTDYGANFEILTKDNSGSTEQRILIDGDGEIILTPTDSVVINGVTKVWDNSDRSRWLDLSDSDIIFNGGDRPIDIMSSGRIRRKTASANYDPNLIMGWTNPGASGAISKYAVLNTRGERQSSSLSSGDYSFIRITTGPSGGGSNALGVIGTLTEDPATTKSSMFFGTRRLDFTVGEALRINSDQELIIGGFNAATEYKLPTARGTNGQVLVSDGSGNVSWGQGSTDSLNVVAGTYVLDVAGVNAVACNTSAGTVTLSGFTGGIVNQVLYIYPTDPTNNIVITNNGAGQAVKTGTGADVTIANDGGATMIFDGTYWRLVGLVQ